MNIKFNGVVSGVQSGDAITKIEIALAVNGETADQAVAAGRSFEITNSTEIANFQSTGTVKVDTPVVQSRRIGWHTASINITGGADTTVAIDGTILFTGTTTAKTGSKIRIHCATQNSEAVIKTAYFSNLRKNGTVIDDLTNVVAGVGGWSYVTSLGTTTQNQSIGGVAGIKLVTDGGATSSVVWDKDLGVNTVGLYEVDFYDIGNSEATIQFRVFDPTNNVTAGFNSSITLQPGYRVIATGLVSNSTNFLSSCIPAVRLTESRGGTGAFVGEWAAGNTIIPIALGSPFFTSVVGGASSVTLIWTAGVIGSPVGYYIYRATSLEGTYSYVAYTTSLTFVDNAANHPASPPVVGTTYWYKVFSTDTFQETGTVPAQSGTPT
jgi:hypothetical protein